MGARHVLFAVLFAAVTPCPAAAESERTDVESLRCAAEAGVPANVVIGDEFLWSLTSEMARRSPTFQRQLAAIGGWPDVTAKVRLVARARSSASLAHADIAHTAAGHLNANRRA